jgi:hypothetical protein
LSDEHNGIAEVHRDSAPRSTGWTASAPRRDHSVDLRALRPT